MRKSFTYSLVGTTVAVLLGAGALAANADWSIPTVGQVRVSTAKAPKGVKPSVAKQGKAAVVSWSAQEIEPGAKMTRYTITAHSQGTPAKAAVVRQVDATGAESQSIIFAANEVAGGTWRWTVTPHFASWTGAESGLSSALTFAPAPAARLAEAPTPKTATPTATTAPAAGPTPEPAAPPVTTKPAAPVEAPPKEEATATPPPVSSPVGQEPPVKGPGPSASGSAPADIPQ